MLSKLIHVHGIQRSCVTTALHAQADLHCLRLPSFSLPQHSTLPHPYTLAQPPPRKQTNPATMTSLTPPPSGPVTRIATFNFLPNVTSAQKGDRARAFLSLYEQHPDLILEKPKGGRPLDTPLALTGVKRDKEWDLGFVVVFRDDEARRKFDADPTHESLKVSGVVRREWTWALGGRGWRVGESGVWDVRCVLTFSRMRRIRCLRRCLCMTLLRRRIWGGDGVQWFVCWYDRIKHLCSAKVRSVMC